MQNSGQEEFQSGGVVIKRSDTFWQLKEQNDDIVRDPERLAEKAEEYIKENGPYINPDRARKNFPKFNWLNGVEKSKKIDAFPGDKISEKAYELLRNRDTMAKVLHLAGGSASGKTAMTELHPYVKEQTELGSVITVDKPMADDPEYEFEKIRTEIAGGKERENCYIYRPLESAMKAFMARPIKRSGEDKDRCMTLPIWAISHYHGQRNVRLARKEFKDEPKFSTTCIDNSRHISEAKIVPEDKIDDFLKKTRCESAESVLRQSAEVFDSECERRRRIGSPVKPEILEEYLGSSVYRQGGITARQLAEEILANDIEKLKEETSQRTGLKHKAFAGGRLAADEEILAFTHYHAAFTSEGGYHITSRSNFENGDELTVGKRARFASVTKSDVEMPVFPFRRRYHAFLRAGSKRDIFIDASGHVDIQDPNIEEVKKCDNLMTKDELRRVHDVRKMLMITPYNLTHYDKRSDLFFRLTENGDMGIASKTEDGLKYVVDVPRNHGKLSDVLTKVWKERHVKDLTVSPFIPKNVSLLWTGGAMDDEDLKAYIKLAKNNPDHKITLTVDNVVNCIYDAVSDRPDFSDHKRKMIFFDAASRPQKLSDTNDFLARTYLAKNGIRVRTNDELSREAELKLKELEIGNAIETLRPKPLRLDDPIRSRTKEDLGGAAIAVAKERLASGKGVPVLDLVRAPMRKLPPDSSHFQVNPGESVSSAGVKGEIEAEGNGSNPEGWDEAISEQEGKFLDTRRGFIEYAKWKELKEDSKVVDKIYTSERYGGKKNFAGGSDYTRMMALIVDGGGWHSDADIRLLNGKLPKNHVAEYGFVMFGKNLAGINNNFYGAMPDSEALMDIFKGSLEDYVRDGMFVDQKTGNSFLYYEDKRTLQYGSQNKYGPEARGEYFGNRFHFTCETGGPRRYTNQIDNMASLGTTASEQRIIRAGLIADKDLYFDAVPGHAGWAFAQAPKSVRYARQDPRYREGVSVGYPESWSQELYANQDARHHEFLTNKRLLSHPDASLKDLGLYTVEEEVVDAIDSRKNLAPFELTDIDSTKEQSVQRARAEIEADLQSVDQWYAATIPLKDWSVKNIQESWKKLKPEEIEELSKLTDEDVLKKLKDEKTETRVTLQGGGLQETTEKRKRHDRSDDEGGPVTPQKKKKQPNVPKPSRTLRSQQVGRN